MRTPIHDFVKEYAASNAVRLHMPGHKGKGPLGCETLDITEISGADALYEASGIIAESEANATELFGTGRTLYSTEGSSQCVRAMLELARRWWLSATGSSRPVILAARNVHKAFLYAAILLDFDVVWLYGEEENPSLCSCVVTPESLEKALAEQKGKVAAVYLTSPNYLGGMADIPAISKVCHRHNTLLLVDNAHGAYLHFLEHSLHPMDLGADICCDSAHKTLPVLTGGAYLHISKTAPEELKGCAKGAMELFGSTSPSYLILQSLDLCNKYLAGSYRPGLALACEKAEYIREDLREQGWQVEATDPMRFTIRAPYGLTGTELAERLRQKNVECEYADADYLVCMVTEQNSVADFNCLRDVLGENKLNYLETAEKKIPLVVHAEQVMPVREAYFAPGEVLPVEQAVGRICRMPTATCPPAIPVVVPGERIEEAAIQCFQHYGIDCVEVIKNG